MIRLIRYLTLAIILFLVLIGTGCVRPNVPTEVVTLSYTLGQDLDAIHVSYRNLINSYFDSLRMQAQNILDDHWNPAFIKDFIQRANLVQLASTANDTQSYNQIVAWANAAVKQIETKKKEVTVDLIIKEVASFFDLKPAEIRSSRRIRSIIQPRQIAIFLSRKLTDYSLAGIGEKFGGKDHATVLHSIKKVEEEMKIKKEFKTTVEKIETRIKST